ncbi:MAG: exosome complex protein Rrp42 [Candidatus Woesearchaeota archaeon]
MNDYIKSILEKGLRLDGRKLDEIRKPITVELGVSDKAEGSARVKIGDTEVIAGIKMDVGKPYTDSPDKGVLITTAELLPLSSPDFFPGPPDQRAIELARVIDRGIRESKMIDFKKLCIKEGELVWIIFLDIYTINNAGNLLDASALAAIAALKSAVLPKLEENKVKFGEFTKKSLPLTEIPLTTTVTKIGNNLIVDSSLEEEQAMEARLSIGISEKGNIHALQKGGETGMTVEEIDKAIEMATKAFKTLNQALPK